jgi:arginase
MEVDAAVEVLGVQMDLGAGVRGVDMGPSAVRYAGLIERLAELGRPVRDRGNVVAAVPQATSPGSDRLRYVDEIAACAVEIQREVGAIFNAGAIPLVLGGDHSLAIGSLAAARDARPDLRVLWLDAHADVNDESSTSSGNVHGIPLGVALGRVAGHFSACGWPERALAPRHVALVGVRDLDPGEREAIRAMQLPVYTVADVDRLGIHTVIERALATLAAPPRSLYVSFDLDVVDPLHAPGVGTPVGGGLTVREAHLALELVAQSGQLAGLDLVEVNPIRDLANATARLAVELALSAFGKRIL